MRTLLLLCLVAALVSVGVSAGEATAAPGAKARADSFAQGREVVKNANRAQGSSPLHNTGPPPVKPAGVAKSIRSAPEAPKAPAPVKAQDSPAHAKAPDSPAPIKAPDKAPASPAPVKTPSTPVPPKAVKLDATGIKLRPGRAPRLPKAGVPAAKPDKPAVKSNKPQPPRPHSSPAPIAVRPVSVPRQTPTTVGAPAPRSAPTAPTARTAPKRRAPTASRRAPSRRRMPAKPRVRDSERRTHVSAPRTPARLLRAPTLVSTPNTSPQAAPPDRAESQKPQRKSVRSAGIALPRPGAVKRTIETVVQVLPAWVLAVFLGFAATAAVATINSYRQSRRAQLLSSHREELLNDVGLLQTALLGPVATKAGDARVSVAYRPADGPAAGGDFYDVIPLAGDRTALLLGDISGHGREALGQAALVRYTLRTLLADGHGPADAVNRADVILRGELNGHFATVIAAVYDHATCELVYANAGHHPPLTRGAVTESPPVDTCPPLGLGLGISPSERTLGLGDDGVVCFYTDGLEEARCDGKLLGREHVHELLSRAPDDAPALVRRVVADADTVSDDLAVCILAR